jgi:carbon monoxide dehydrogenase subunit G
MELVNEFHVAVPVDEAWNVLTDVERIAPCLPGAELQEIEGEQYRGVVKVKVGPITAQYKGTASFVEQDATAHRAVLKAEGRDTRGQGNANATVTATLAEEAGGTTVKVVTDLTITGKVAQFGRGALAEVSGKLIAQFVHNLERDVLGATVPAAAAPPADLTPAAPADLTPAAAVDLTSADPAPADLTPADLAPADRTPADLAPAVSSANGAATEVAGPASNGAGTATATIRRIDSAPAQPVDLVATAGGSVLKRLLPVVAVALIAVVVVRRWRRH